MNELRKDYLLDRWVIIAKDRAKRPTDFVRQKTEEKPSVCYFCPGNESMTPPEIDRIEEDGKWVIRCFPNKFPAVTKEFGEIWDGMLSKMPAWGSHEVIAETPSHGESLGDLSVERMVAVLNMYISRIAELRKDARTKYVMIFKNQGKEAGASLDHSHTQIISLPIIPPLVKAEADAAAKYTKEKHKCPYCDIILKEKGGERRIFEDEHTIAFAPFASRFPFEAWVMPKRHMRSLDELTVEEKQSFAATLKKVIGRLDASLNRPPYNFWLHYSPDGCDLHLHLELATRLSNFAGMEYGSETVINVVPPESAAAHYRGE
jgi:UDPglucose--hexose-1-phosphate uridylyltransferase